MQLFFFNRKTGIMKEPNSLCHLFFCLDPCPISSSVTHQSTVIMQFSSLVLALNMKELWSKTDTRSLCHEPNNFQNQRTFKKLSKTRLPLKQSIPHSTMMAILFTKAEKPGERKATGGFSPSDTQTMAQIFLKSA